MRNYRDIRRIDEVFRDTHGRSVEIEDFSDEELEAVLDDLDALDLTDGDEDIVELVHPEPVPGEEDEMIHEGRVLGLVQRRKLSQRFKVYANRFARLRALRANRLAEPKRLQMRARKAAIMALRRKVAGDRGSKYSSLQPAQKISIDKQVNQRFGTKLSSVVGKLAPRFLPMIRKKEQARLAKHRGSGRDLATHPVHQGVPNMVMAGYDPKIHKGGKLKEDAEIFELANPMMGIRHDMERNSLQRKHSLERQGADQKRRSVLLIRHKNELQSLLGKHRKELSHHVTEAEISTDFKLIKVRLPSGKYTWKKSRKNLVPANESRDYRKPPKTNKALEDAENEIRKLNHPVLKAHSDAVAAHARESALHSSGRSRVSAVDLIKQGHELLARSDEFAQAHHSSAVRAHGSVSQRIVSSSMKKLGVFEGAGFEGTKELVDRYVKDTPGMSIETGDARYIAPLPWARQDTEGSSKSPKTYADVRRVIAGKR